MGLLIKIEMVRKQLHELIEQNASYDSIYCKSAELDLLICSYYKLSYQG